MITRYAINFKTLPVDSKTAKSLHEYLGNWRTAHAHVSKLPETEVSLNVIVAMIQLELANGDGARKHILNRLHMTLNRMRGRVESKQLLRHAKRN